MSKFEIGKTYRCSNHWTGKCQWRFRVTSRTETAVRVVGDDGKSHRLNVVDVDNVERCFPLKRLRAGLILTADSLDPDQADSVTYQKVFDESVGWVYEVRVNGEYIDNFKRLRDVKQAYPTASKRGDDPSP